jgi:hypothetical protein
MTKAKDHVSIPYLHSCVILDAASPSGLRWRDRAEMSKGWNTRWAGKSAGSLNSKGYWVLDFCGREVRAHRVIFALTYGRWPVGEVDHRNQSKADNDIENLREATRAQNQQNRGANRNSASGLKGVSWSKLNKRWHVTIKVDGHSIHRGSFNTKEAALQASLAAQAELHPFAGG